jgi:hypothetical protein
MKKLFPLLLVFCACNSFAQDHYIGVNTSSRAGILNGSLNPAEFANLSKKFEVNIYGMSVNLSNNIVSLSDLDSDTDIEDLIFNGNSTVDMSVDAEITGLGVAMKWKKWGFGITSKAHIKFDLVDIDPNLGQGIINSEDLVLGGSTVIGNDYNQRMNGTSWGEIGLSAARNVFENDKHRFNAGLTLKLLFPGSYSNFGMDKFTGTITNSIDINNPNATSAYLHSTSANLNFAYSGNLANSFTDASDYTESIYGGLNGFATDLGVNYQWKDGDTKKYKINAGMSIRNIGSMTFNDGNNASTSYVLSIPNQSIANGPGLDLTLFENAESLKDVEKILLDSGYLTTESTSKDFKVKLPTTFNVYADFKVYHKFYITGQLQQKLNDNNNNDQITAHNNFSIIPRINLGFFEAYIPFSNNEISGSNTGFGFRLGGFYLGSGSVVSALINDSKQIDFNMGFRWAFL